MTYQKDGIFVECSEAKYNADYKRFGYTPVQEPTAGEDIPTVAPREPTEPETPAVKGMVKK